MLLKVPNAQTVIAPVICEIVIQGTELFILEVTTGHHCGISQDVECYAASQCQPGLHCGALSSSFPLRLAIPAPFFLPIRQRQCQAYLKEVIALPLTVERSMPSRIMQQGPPSRVGLSVELPLAIETHEH